MFDRQAIAPSELAMLVRWAEDDDIWRDEIRQFRDGTSNIFIRRIYEKILAELEDMREKNNTFFRNYASDQLRPLDMHHLVYARNTSRARLNVLARQFEAVMHAGDHVRYA